jgi:hypothetical protein
MIKTSPSYSTLLNGAIALLVLFIGMQLYGIITGDPASRVQSGIAVRDSTEQLAVKINVLNGCGVSGVGIVMTKYCRAAGYDVVEMGNYRSFDVKESMVIDRTGTAQEAQRLAAYLGIAQKNVIQQFSNDHLVAATVVIGKDYQSLNPWK